MKETKAKQQLTFVLWCEALPFDNIPFRLNFTFAS